MLLQWSDSIVQSFEEKRALAAPSLSDRNSSQIIAEIRKTDLQQQRTILELKNLLQSANANNSALVGRIKELEQRIATLTEAQRRRSPTKRASGEAEALPAKRRRSDFDAVSVDDPDIESSVNKSAVAPRALLDGDVPASLKKAPPGSVASGRTVPFLRDSSSAKKPKSKLLAATVLFDVIVPLMKTFPSRNFAWFCTDYMKSYGQRDKLKRCWELFDLVAEEEDYAVLRGGASSIEKMRVCKSLTHRAEAKMFDLEGKVKDNKSRSTLSYGALGNRYGNWLRNRGVVEGI